MNKYYTRYKIFSQAILNLQGQILSMIEEKELGCLLEMSNSKLLSFLNLTSRLTTNKED